MDAAIISSGYGYGYGSGDGCGYGDGSGYGDGDGSIYTGNNWDMTLFYLASKTATISLINDDVITIDGISFTDESGAIGYLRSV